MSLSPIQLLGYFETVYIRTEGLRPRFQPSTWNVHLHTLRGEHRTNNMCKGWDKFSRLVGHSHPTIWHCIAVLLKDEVASRHIIIQYELGEEEVRQQPSIYSTVGTRLLSLCMRYRRGETYHLDFRWSCFYILLY